jgi:hypothetical protein
MTTTDLGRLRADAARTQAAITLEEGKAAAAAALAAEERRQREIAWAFDRIATYPSRQAEANGAVLAILPTFDAAVEDGTSPAVYLALIRAMTAANAVAAEVETARGILANGDVIPRRRPNTPAPTGAAAPWPMIGVSALPTYEAMVASALDAARMRASRIPASTVDPGDYRGTVSEAMRHDVLWLSFDADAEAELLLALEKQYPDVYAERIPADQQAQIAAYAACREARGYAEPLPKAAPPVGWIQRGGFPTAREEAERRGRMP